MKSFLTYFLSILFIISSATSYSQENGESNSPGENEYISKGSSSSKVLEEKCIELENETNVKSERIQKLYFFQQEVLDSYGGGTQTITKSIKKNIFNAGEILIDEQREKILDLPFNDYSSRLESLRKIEKIQDKLISYSGNKNTRQIEKNLKRLKDANLIEPIFFQEQ
jgi:hypothetical protein